jgi:hypothetical protein
MTYSHALTELQPYQRHFYTIFRPIMGFGNKIQGKKLESYYNSSSQDFPPGSFAILEDLDEEFF